jgi:putative lipoic acid-binding regulatory protein
MNEKPKITYPCAYPIKVMGEHDDTFESVIVAIIERHDPDLVRETISLRASRNGRYVSLNVTITATGPDQIQALFNDLKASGRVAMVL